MAEAFVLGGVRTCSRGTASRRTADQRFGAVTPRDRDLAPPSGTVLSHYTHQRNFGIGATTSKGGMSRCPHHDVRVVWSPYVAPPRRLLM